MEIVTIQEASRRLLLSRSVIRQCIRDGELKAHRQAGPDARPVWMVELPEEGWTCAALTLGMDQQVSPWWWANKQRTGHIHYVEGLSASSWEEIVSRFLCGLRGENIWPVHDLLEDRLCPPCLEEAKRQGLPLSI